MTTRRWKLEAGGWLARSGLESDNFAAGLFLVALGHAALAQYSIDWSTLDGGGGTSANCRRSGCENVQPMRVEAAKPAPRSQYGVERAPERGHSCPQPCVRWRGQRTRMSNAARIWPSPRQRTTPPTAHWVGKHAGETPHPSPFRRGEGEERARSGNSGRLPITRDAPPFPLSPSDGERAGVRGRPWARALGSFNANGALSLSL